MVADELGLWIQPITQQTCRQSRDQRRSKLAQSHPSRRMNRTPSALRADVGPLPKESQWVHCHFAVRAFFHELISNCFLARPLVLDAARMFIHLMADLGLGQP